MDQLVRRVVNTVWRETDQSDAMLCNLLRLPSHLLNRCIVAFMKMKSSQGLHDLLSFMPLPLHSPLIAASAASDLLRISMNQRFLVLLSNTVVPHPGLLNAVLERPSEAYKLRPTTQEAAGDSTDDDESCDGDQSCGMRRTFMDMPCLQSCICSKLAALLGQALSAHPSVARIVFRKVHMPPESLKMFIGCLSRGALQQLTTLRIRITAHPGGCAALASCLRRFPALKYLRVSIKLNRNASEDSVKMFLGNVAAPAHLPSLQRLIVYENEEATEETSCFPVFLRLVSAPSLMFVQLQSNASKMDRKQLFASLAGFSSLTTVALESSEQTSTTILTPDQLIDDTEIQPIASLSKMTFASRSPLAPLHNAAFTDKIAPNLRSLSIVSSGFHEYFAKKVMPMDMKKAWATLFPVIGRCRNLQHLELAMLPGVHGCTIMDNSRALAAALKCLPALTSLELSTEKELVGKVQCRVLHGMPLAAALSFLKALRVFSVCHGNGELEMMDPKAVLAAIATLRHLSELRLCFNTDEAVQLAGTIRNLSVLTALEVGEKLSKQPGNDVKQLQAQFGNVLVSKCDCLQDSWAK